MNASQLVGANFKCPNCHIYLIRPKDMPARTNCPVCASEIALDIQGKPTLLRVGPSAVPTGLMSIAGVVIGGTLGAVLSGPGGALIGGAVGVANESLNG